MLLIAPFYMNMTSPYCQTIISCSITKSQCKCLTHVLSICDAEIQTCLISANFLILFLICNRDVIYHLRLPMQFGNGIQGRTQRLAEEVFIANKERLVQVCRRFLQPLLHLHPCTLQFDNLDQQDSTYSFILFGFISEQTKVTTLMYEIEVREID